jgi:hypothetical protein
MPEIPGERHPNEARPVRNQRRPGSARSRAVSERGVP